MKRLNPILITAIVIVVVLLLNTLYVVPQTQQALVLRFGDAQRVINAANMPGARPGLYVKAPFLENVVMFDRRNLGLNLAEQTIIAADQEQLVVDAYMRWRIVDPLRFYQAVQNEGAAESRLEALMTGALRRVLGSAPSNDIVSGRRGQLMVAIRDEMNREARQWGVVIVDVRIRQADLPPETAERVYERMRTERQQFAAEIRARGDEEAAKIRADADRQVSVTLGEGREQSERIRGEGEGRRAALFSQAYGRDPEFAGFYRSLQAYEKAIPKGTQMVIPPDGEFFRYLKDKEGR